MYIPKAYLEEEWPQIEYLIKNFPLATVITTSPEGEMIANHLPFYLKVDPETGAKHLHAHMAKVNHQIPSLKESDNVLVIFQSSSSYITPSYYATKKETEKVVPTWDFASVHIYGKSKIIDDFDFVRLQITNLTDQEEKTREKPWKITDAPENYTRLKQKAIVGLQIEIGRTECKFKFEQGLKKSDVDGVIDGLASDELHGLSKLVVDSNQRYDVKRAQKASSWYLV